MFNEAGDTPRVSPAFQHTVMYWLLSALAFALFVPAALLPVYRDYAGWRLHRARVEAGIEALEEKVAENEAVIDALRTDPGVNARILARDLNYVAPGERIVRVLDTPARDDVARRAAAVRAAAVSVQPREDAVAELKPWEAQVERRLGGGPWMQVFTDPTSRSVILVLSGILVLAAVVLYPPRR